MILYQATETLFPFFEKGDEKTLDEWVKKLNISQEDFQNCNFNNKYFMTVNHEIIVAPYNGFARYQFISVGRTNIALTADEITSLCKDIGELLKKYNNTYSI